MVAREKLPPERISMYPNRLPLVIMFCKAEESRNGTGTAAPSRNSTMIIRV